MAIDPNKKSFTPEEESLIEETFNRYIEQQTEAVPDADIVAIIKELWMEMGKGAPEITVHDSPAACKAACPDTSSFSTYWNMWLCSYAATYDFAQQIGVEFDQKKFRLFQEYCRCCPFILFNDNRVYASRKLVELHFNDNSQLHNESGMACKFADGWGCYVINGVSVDEQIVIRPETQTVKQIRDEQNEEIKRIRISRFGWGRYLDEIKAVVIDTRRNDIEGTEECLLRSEKDNMTALVCVCPSTAKEFILEVPPNTKTCREAQSWLSGGLSERIISAS